MNKLLNISIKGISFELGSNELMVKSFAKNNPDWDIEKIISKTGIEKVFYTHNNQTAVDLSILTVEKFF